MEKLAQLYNDKAMLKAINESIEIFINEKIVEIVDKGDNPVGYGEAKKVIRLWNQELGNKFNDKKIIPKEEFSDAE